jgi:hypothetical protein
MILYMFNILSPKFNQVVFIHFVKYTYFNHDLKLCLYYYI